MQVTETLNTGLKREIKMTVPASDMEARLMKRLVTSRTGADQRLPPGQGAGAAPAQGLRQVVHGRSRQRDPGQFDPSIVTERGEKAAMQPEVKMTEDEEEAEKILNGGVDFEFELAYEVIPAIEVKDPRHQGDPKGLRRARKRDRGAGEEGGQSARS